MILLLLIGLLFLLTFLGLPLVYSLLCSCIVTLLIYRPELPFMAIVQLFIDGIDSSLLLAIILFFLTGELMNKGGITNRLMAFAQASVGWIKGGMAQVNILTSVLFSGITGSAVSDTAAVGGIMIPTMIKMGYSRPFSAAVTQTSSVIGPIIPPSIPVIVYAVLAEVSVGKMFISGILPGLLIALVLMVVTYVISKHRNYPSEQFAGFKIIGIKGYQAILALGSVILIVGGILGGIFSPTEAGAVAVFYSLILGTLIYRELNFTGFYESFLKAAKGTSSVLVILGASNIFAWILADRQVGLQLNDLLASWTDNPLLTLFIISAFLFLIGLVMDPLASLIIVVPIFLPVVTSMGIDPIHFGIIVIFNLMIGLCTPPIGYLIYLSAGLAETKPEKVILESVPFIIALLIALLLIIVFPSITLTMTAFYN